MKTVIDLNGNQIQVVDSTPVKTINGVHYLLSQADVDHVLEREQSHSVLNKERKTNLLKDEIRNRLKETDFVMLSHSPITNKADFVHYRKALRDFVITDSVLDIPYDQVLPTKPNEIK